MVQVYDDQRTLNSYQIFDGKEVAIQFSDEAASQDKCLLMVRVWKPSTWQLTDIT